MSAPLRLDTRQLPQAVSTLRMGERVLLPLAVQVHHAVCDGFHLSRLIADVEALIAGETFRALP